VISRLTIGLVVVAGTVVAAPSSPGAARLQWAVAVLPSGQEIDLDLALDPASQARGLAGRERVAPDEGMLFVFPASEPRSFWMKDCLVPLDIVWLDEQLRVVGVAADQPPCPAAGPCPGIPTLHPVRYVLELAGGMAARYGVEPGARITIVSEPPLP
jgi:uncharacterized membrane protein (UPF0127 family)